MLRKTLSLLLVPVAAVSLAVPAAAQDPGVRFGSSAKVWPGVVFRPFRTGGSGGPVSGEYLEVDLRDPHVTVGLLHPPAVGAREPVSVMTNLQHAVAGVNGDFFNISESHAGVAPTGAAVGPEIANGRDLKAAVPDGQRFGPLPPPGTSAETVIGVGRDRVGRLSNLHLTGAVRGARVRLALRGLNQYALPVGGVGAFTAGWGPVSRLRAVCGSDIFRNDPCSPDTAEAVVRHGVVTWVGDGVGAGQIPPDTTVLTGREEGADALRGLRTGDRVRITYRLTGPDRPRFAVGGFPILRDGVQPAGLDPLTLAARTGAGVSRDGRRMYLVVVDSGAASAGMTVTELATLLTMLGATDGVDLDGGGSTTLALRLPGEPRATVRNVVSGSAERAVANGIGVFVRP